jgi:uncharacterized protein with NRDE domain
VLVCRQHWDELPKELREEYSRTLPPGYVVGSNFLNDARWNAYLAARAAVTKYFAGRRFFVE